jgi:hypothetical protein
LHIVSSTTLVLPWYWTPYILGLGLLDWLEDVTQVTHTGALRQGTRVVSRERHSILRFIPALILLGTLLVYFVRAVLAPWLASGAFKPTPAQLRWGSAFIALLAVSFMAWLIARALWRGLLSLYARGYRRLLARRRL